MRLGSCAAGDGLVDRTVPFLLLAGVAQAVERLRKQIVLVRVSLSAYFFMYPYDWKHLLKGIGERASMMGVLGTQRGSALALFQR